MRLLIGWMLLLFGASALQAQPTAIVESRSLIQDAFSAYEAHDYTTFRNKLKAAHALRPHHPGLIYNLAAAHARTGNSEEALAALADYAAMGLVAEPQGDADFQSVHAAEQFEKIVAEIAENRQPIGTPDTAFVLGNPAFIPEGIAYDDTTRTFFVGSVHQRRIVQVDSTGRSTLFADAEDGLWSVLGMAVDTQRRRLWVCTAALPQGQGVSPEQVGRTALLAFDIDTGRVLLRIVLDQSTGEEHQLGDLAIGAGGSVYVTDARLGALYKWDEETGDELQRILGPGTLASPQGLCVMGDDSLLLADYSLGVLRVDLASETVHPMEVPEHTTLLGIDGLACTGDIVLAVQNGVRPHRVLQLFRDSDGQRFIRVRRLAANLPPFDEPTLGTIVGDAFFLVANSQWGHFDKEGHLPDESELRPPVVLKFAIEAD